jgi:DNA repair protein RadD
MKRELRPHQVKAIEMLRQSLGSGKRRPVLQAPTGFGKTLLAAAVVEGALAKKKRVIFTVPALSLVDQAVEAFWNERICDVGVIQGSHPMTDWSRPVQVASVQTLQRRPIPEADVIIIDECHRWFDFYGKWMADPAWQSRPFIGLSATPWTRGLGQYFDDLIIAATTQDLISERYLSPFRVFAPSHPDLSDVRTVAGDYHEGDLSEVMRDSPLVADVVDTWLRRAENRSTFCFAVDRAHARHLQAKFAEADVQTGYIDAYTPSSERCEIERRFHDGDIRVVCNVGCLTTGIDWDVRCIVLARPTKSEILFVQIIGRGLRPAKGKEDCLILDHSDTHLRLGFVTDIHHEVLDDGRPRANARASDRIRRRKNARNAHS